MNRYVICILCIIMVASISLRGQEKDERETKQSHPFSQAKFVPDIAFILDMSGAYRNLGDDTYKRLRMKGVTSGHTNEFNKKTGFNLNYGELALSAAVDPYFELTGIMHFSPEEIGIEEGYASTTAIPWGFGVKAGKFKSSFGRLNIQHAHVWDFSDMPVVHQAMFGAEGLNEAGVHLSWVAPIDVYLTIGAEALQGDNETSFGAEGFHDPLFIYRIGGNKGPNTYVGYMKSSLDAGNLSVLYGLSGAYGWTRSYAELGDAAIDVVDIETWATGLVSRGIKGATWIAGADLTVKYLIDSYRNVSFQGEYIYRSTRGGSYNTYTDLNTGEVMSFRLPYEKRISGMYSQVIIKPFMRWRFGGRFEMLRLEKKDRTGLLAGNPGNLIKASGMIDFHPSEFSLLRLQYNHDRTGCDRYNHRRINNEVILQANIAIGAHGAHPY